MYVTPSRSPAEEEEADDQELTYADVKVVQRQARRMEQSAQEEVEYGQVKFTKHPQRSEPAADDCVYAKVRKGRWFVRHCRQREGKICDDGSEKTPERLSPSLMGLLFGELKAIGTTGFYFNMESKCWAVQ